MNDRSLRRYLLASFALTLAPSGCGALLGLDDFTESAATGSSGTGGTGGAGGATGSSSGTETGTSSASSAGGGPATTSTTSAGTGGASTSSSGTGGEASSASVSSSVASSSAGSSSSSGGPICAAGAVVECSYSGPPATKNVGMCMASVKVCAADGNSFGACSAEVLPQAQENCKAPGDENCDGKACSDVDWANLFGDAKDQTPSGIAVDSMGNVVVVGSFKGSLTLAAGVTVTSTSGSRDYFLAQFDKMGNPLWIKGFGDAADNGNSIHVAVNKGNEIIIAGSVTGKADFGAGLIPTAGGGGSDIFVAKFGQTGTFQWAQVVGDALDQDVFSVATDSAANIILGGRYQGSFSFSGNGPAAATGTDGFVTKLMPNGSPLWIKRFTEAPAKATDSQTVGDVAVDSQNNIICTGYFQTSISVGAINVNEIGGGDMYLAKLNSAGTEQWVKPFGTVALDSSNAVAVDSADHILLTGYFAGSGSINFGGGGIVGQGLYDGFIASFTSAGLHQWSKRFGSTTDNSGIPDEGRDLAIDKADNVLLTGLLYGAANFGGVGDQITSAGGSDVFIAKLDTTGSHIWSKIFGDLNDQTVGGIATDPVTSQVLLATGVQGSIDFGNGSLPASGIDVGVAKFEP